MKLSKYNFFYSDKLSENDDIIVYNSRTGALSIIEPIFYTKLMDYNTNSRSCNSDFEKQLIDCGFVVDNNVDELKLIKYNLLAQRFDSSHMTLTIAPTMSCNFRCSYCFEKN